MILYMTNSMDLTTIWLIMLFLNKINMLGMNKSSFMLLRSAILINLVSMGLITFGLFSNEISLITKLPIHLIRYMVNLVLVSIHVTLLLRMTTVYFNYYWVVCPLLIIIKIIFFEKESCTSVEIAIRYRRI